MTRALDRVPGGVMSLSGDLRIVSANEGLCALVGRPREELIGKAFDVLLSAPSRILFQTHVYPALRADGLVEEVFLTLAAPEREPVPVLLNAVRTPAGGGDVAYEGLVVRIRARSRWETELLAATRALERERTASEQIAGELSAALEGLAARTAEEQRNREFRDAFVGVISHELRTPITTIFGMSHVLGRRFRSMDVETVARHLDDIEAEAERLRWLTENLLVLSRAEGGRLTLAAEPMALAHVVRRAVTAERRRLGEREIRLEVEADLPLVLGEEPYVEQVVQNFLSNAAKYSPAEATIRVTVTTESDGVAVRVIDAGPGVPEGALDHLFDLFYRAPGAARQAAGAGIGLFVCRELVRAMNGRIWSAPAPPPAEHGAEFGFWLPAASDDALDSA